MSADDTFRQELSEFAHELRALRLRTGMSVEELAKFAEVSKESIQKWERNPAELAHHVPDQMWLFKLYAAAFKLNDRQFMQVLLTKTQGKRGKVTVEEVLPQIGVMDSRRQERIDVASRMLASMYFGTGVEFCERDRAEFDQAVGLSVLLADKLIARIDQDQHSEATA